MLCGPADGSAQVGTAQPPRIMVLASCRGRNDVIGTLVATNNNVFMAALAEKDGAGTEEAWVSQAGDGARVWNGTSSSQASWVPDLGNAFHQCRARLSDFRTPKRPRQPTDRPSVLCRLRPLRSL